MLKHIYDKSDKGREEIATRKYHIAAKLRSLLVMIDGHRPLEDLMKNFGPLGLSVEHMSELLEGEYIVLIDDGEPEPELDSAPAHRPGMSARARMAARRGASANASASARASLGLDQLDLDGNTVTGTLQPDSAESERHLALHEFYSQTIKSTLGLRGMMLQMKVEKCAGIDDFRELREAYLDAVLKAKGREMALSLSGRLDQLLAMEAGG